MIEFFRTIFYKPLYNLLVHLISILPGGSVGFAIIIITLLVKLILLPFNIKTVVSQIQLKKIQPEIQKIKDETEDKTEQAKKTMELYKKYGVSPFSGCLPILIQIPVIISLYYVFFQGVNFDTSLLYSGISIPETINASFFGADLAGRSLILAILAGVSQFFQISLVNKRNPQNTGGSGMQAQIGKSLQFQMKYILPIFIVFIAYRISGAVALYWIVNNVFTIVLELIIAKKYKDKPIVLVEKA
jgi:YidC/Oxa1 family membrane protein insertase